MILLSKLARRSAIEPNGCWVWFGARNGRYGQIRGAKGGDGQKVSTHRCTYEAFAQPIPEGWHLHHVCGNTLCWRWDHLQPIAPSEHRGADVKRVTHCPRGHPYDEANTLLTSHGGRSCRECGRARHRDWNRRVAGDCIDCGTPLASKTAKRCRHCHLRYARAQRQ